MATKQTKPLMISGKRLLLALDILRFARNVRLTPGNLASQEPRRFSAIRVFETIRRLRPAKCSCSEGEIASNSYAWSGTHHFLRANAAAIAGVMFDAMPLLEQNNWSKHFALPLFRAIASGELKEEDFKE